MIQLASTALLSSQKQQEEAVECLCNDINNAEELRDALFMFFRLPDIATLGESEQLLKMVTKYPIVHDYMEQDEQEELQEMAALTVPINDQPIHDTKDNVTYDPEDLNEEEMYQLEEVKDVTKMKLFEEITNGKKVNGMCQGCGLPLMSDKDKRGLETSKFWKGYKRDVSGSESGHEYIFHNGLCVKLRRCKESIRNAVYTNDGSKKEWLSIDYSGHEKFPEHCKPACYTTWDEQFAQQSLRQNIIEYRRAVKAAMYRELDLVGVKEEEGLYFIRFIQNPSIMLTTQNSDRFEGIPQELKYLDFREFGVPLWDFLIQQAQIRQFPKFWEFLTFFSSTIPTPKMLDLLEEYGNFLFPLYSERNPELMDVFTIAAEVSIYPIHTCLYIAAMPSRYAGKTWSDELIRHWTDHFIGMARALLSNIESEHLMAVTLELPSNINGLTCFDIAINNEMLQFLQDPRISAYATSMWHERKLIHPIKHLGDELNYLDQLKRLVKTPAKFYYSPSGFNIVRTVLYLVYLALFCIVTYELRYNYHNHFNTSEVLLWWFNIGLVLFVVYSLGTNASGFLKRELNIVDVVLASLWTIIFIMRFIIPADPLYHEVTVSNTNGTAATSQREFDGPKTRSQTVVIVFMTLWSIQSILMWAKS
ncbi:hypothetical protein RFI_05724 [Reticulomyxa filosa]|uniref:Uncharacterized protein n=1 Tax=Reticulomyxa filosa TaxID=46433 RepID=X6NZW1_RETFI|nr:hypothetical protein RFI_05724 [Reticulomyxa filosa]|eukprot:ETO31398.1 hypothetical protein RFI_05724 [Reticulomyxa filosa]